ncbi:MAG: signal recognition particle-docking protein FtsY [Nitrospirae bacterium]|nr:signal recognition particle-docking protein FtsY [Nitrospirota bacterium]
MLRRIKGALSKTRQRWRQGLGSLIHGKKAIDADLLEHLEEILLSADLGVHTAQRLLSGLRDRLDRHERADPSRLNAFLKTELLTFLKKNESPLEVSGPVPFVVMMVGVNGVGKTTTIGKLALKFSKEGRSVILVAGDTFRAAAIEQLDIWGQRVGCPVIKHQSGSDPSAVIFDGLSAAKARGTEVVIVDTAGRMHTKFNLMEELKKMKRVMDKALPGSPHETLLVLDATTGQNAVSQAKQFHEAIGVTGVVLTKLDGTARGGVVVAIAEELGIPVKLVGVGEGLEDIEVFSAEDFVEGLFGD